jgi:tetratricopeptide (TPR) repeat protein
LHSREFEKARDASDCQLQENDEDAETWNARSLAEYMLGNAEIALHDIKKALYYNPYNPESYNLYTRLLYEDNQLNEAEKACEKSLELDSSLDSNLTAYRLYGCIAWASRNYDQALERLRVISSDDLPTRLYRANILWEKGCVDEAISVIQETENDVSSILYTGPLLADDHAEDNEPRTPYDNHEDTQKEDKKYSKALTRTDKNDISIRNNYANLFLLRGEIQAREKADLDAAIHDYDLAARCIRQCNYDLYRVILVEMAVAFYRQDDVHAAETYLDTLLTWEPTHVLANYNRCLMHITLAEEEKENQTGSTKDIEDHYLKGLACIQRASKQNPNDVETRIVHGDILYALQRYDEAIMVANKLINQQPERFEGFEQKARAQKAKGEYKEALETLSRGGIRSSDGNRRVRL